MGMEIDIGGRIVGDGHPCFVVAEIGSNHNQDYNLALRLIDAAAEAGADAVKFQTFAADEHVSQWAESPAYLEERQIHKLLETLELDRSWQESLHLHAMERGCRFFSSPCDRDAVDGLEAIGVPIHKVASFDLSDTDLIGYIAATGKPVILSTGLADWMDVQRGIDAARNCGNRQVILLQCTSLYPAPNGLSNLRAMDSMRSAFGLLTGYSDHTIGDLVPCAAVARGACVLEKHFTIDRALPGPDHSFAMEPQEFADMVHRIRQIEAAVGDGIKNGPRPEEREMAEKTRRSLHAAQAIAEGTVVTAAMLRAKRPGHGIAPHLREEIIGRVVRRDVRYDEWITWDMF